MLLSPFRIRLFLALPIVTCCWLWFNSHGPPRGERSWVTWDRRYIANYIIGNSLTLPELQQRIAWLHPYQFEFPGIRYHSTTIDPAAPAPFASQLLFRTLSIHYAWFVALSTLPLALYQLATRHRRRAAARLRQGLCPHCAYDLRAHLPGQSCPECGTPIPSPPNPSETLHPPP